MDIKFYNIEDKQIIKKLNQNIIINKELYFETIQLKLGIDNIAFSKWKIIRSISTDYEIIGNNRIHNIEELKIHNIISRAYYKLWEILQTYHKTFKFFEIPQMNIACLAEAPGGFVQALLHYRNNHFNDNITAISLYENKKNIKFKNVKCKIIYGNPEKNHDGNLYNPEIIEYFINSHKNKLDLITADGGIQLMDYKENYKSQYHLHLFLCELYISLKLLKSNGIFILKVYELCSTNMIDFMIIINKLYKKVNIFKPKTSREMNNEKYIICRDLKPNNDQIIKDIYQTIKYLWKNPNKMIKSFLRGKDRQKHKGLKNLISNIEKRNLLKQKGKLEKAIKYKENSKDELKIILKQKQPKHIFMAKKWYKENNINLKFN
jgi:23S rRNA U2552 (ribose-2'-O)-methylase RlmE/FtsJ